MSFQRYRGRSSRRRGRRSLASRQGGTGSTFSGSVGMIRHSNTVAFTLGTGSARAFDLVCFNPTLRGTPVAADGSSTKVLINNFTADGSRVDYVTIQLTILQTDTTKNNTIYAGIISTSFNQGQLSAALMTTNFKDMIESNAAGEMKAKATVTGLTMGEYSYKDILQHNIKGLMRRQMQLYSGRTISVNQTVPTPRRNKRQQNGSGFWLVLMNDSSAITAGSDVEIRLDTFFKEIPGTVV